MLNNIRQEDITEIAIIGGTGVCDPILLQNKKQIKIYTPFGAPSSEITLGTLAGIKVAFLPRHGETHNLPPHLVPYRANIYALKQLGIKRIIAPAAVGSLHEEMRPGDIVLVDQFFDLTKGRTSSFYEGGTVCHISVAEPFCTELRDLAASTLKKIGFNFHDKGLNICIQGPRFSTKAESMFFRNVIKGDVIGMTLVPECVLAREAEICYLPLCTVTDYDSWSDKHVNNTAVKNTMKQNLELIRETLKKLIPQIPEPRNQCLCKEALKNAIM